MNLSGWRVMAAALIAGMTACNTLDDPAATVAPMTYTMTVTATKSPDEALTRALSLDGKTLNATWKAGDKVDVYTIVDGAYNSVYTKAGTLTASTDGTTTTLTGTVTFTGKPRLGLYYGSPSWTYKGQKGTLQDISDHFDYAVAGLTASKYTITAGAIVPTNGPVIFSNQQAIVKFILRDVYGNPITTKKLTLRKTGRRYFNLSHDVNDAFTTNDEKFDVGRNDEASNEFFVAIPPISDFDIRLEAITGDSIEYTCEQKNVQFDRGKYYEVTVTMRRSAATIDLTNLTEDITLVDGDTLMGELDGSTQKVKVSVEDGATVTLRNATIAGVHYGGNSDDTDCLWAGLTCLGDATIVLADGTTNTVTNFNRHYPCIQPAVGKTLVIKGGPLGTGKLIANNSEWGAGIGGGRGIDCGNIEIQGGDITATGGGDAAGIGSGSEATCGDITIIGGTVTATGGEFAAGIGSGSEATCGDITITGGPVTAIGGGNAAGIGGGMSGLCGNITIMGATVKSKGFGEGTGIGCGGCRFDSFTPSVCGDISIDTNLYEEVYFSVDAIKGDEAYRPIGISYIDESYSRCGAIRFGGSDIDSFYAPDDGWYGYLYFEKNGDTWTLTSASTD